MAYTWAVHPSYNDLIIGTDGALVDITGAEQVKQRILITLQHYWEEYFLNVPAGVPWYELILGSKDLNTAQMIIRSAILSVPDVVSIITFSFTPSNTKARDFNLYANVEVNGISGPSIISITSNLIIPQ